jgi:hypothetical protein
VCGVRRPGARAVGRATTSTTVVTTRRSTRDRPKR